MRYKLRGQIALVITLLAAGALAGASAQAAQIEGLRLGKHKDKTRLVFDLSGPTAYSMTTLENPARLVVSFPDTDSNQLSQMSFKGTPISDISSVQGADSSLRITLTLTTPVDAKSFLLQPHLSRGDRLVIDLYEELHQRPGSTGGSPTLTEELNSQMTSSNAPQPAHPKSTIAASPSKTVSDVTTPKRHSRGTQVAFSGTWEQEWAYQSVESGSQKFESLLEPRVDIKFASGSKLVAIARVRLDTVGDLGPSADRPDNYSDANGPLYNSESAELSLRELYLDTQWAGINWRLGKQQVVWGQADGIKILDVINPQSFREFILDDFDDSRIPLWMVNAELPLANGYLQLLWVPDTTYHELAEFDTPYFLTSPKWIPAIPSGVGVQLLPLQKPNNPLKDGDLGARYSVFAGGWDITLNYLYHYQDYPVLYQQLEQHNDVDVLQIAPSYERNHLIGGTLSNAFDSFTLRAELAYSTDTYHTSSSLAHRGTRNSSEIASVVGLDWQYSGTGLLSAQWFLTYLPDYSRDIIRDESENTASVLFQQGFANDAWQLRVLGLYSMNDKDTMFQFKLKYWLLSNLEVWFGGDFFNGSKHGSFGQFDDKDRLLLGLEYGF